MEFKTAKDIQKFTLALITLLIQLPHKSETSVYEELSESSGLSRSLVRHFHKGIQRNLTIDSLDRLMVAVKRSILQATME